MSDRLAAGTAQEIRSSSPSGRTAATISLILFLTWVGVVMLLHFLRPELSPVSEFISDYATGPFGLLMTVAFLAWAAGLAAFVITVFQGVALSPKSWSSLILLSLCSFFMVLVGIFPGDPGDVVVSRSGEIHNLASLLFFLLLMTSMLVLSIRLRKRGFLTGIYRTLFWLAIVAPISFVLMIALSGAGMVGMGQRIFVFILIGWLSLFALGVRRGTFRGMEESIQV